MRWWTGAVMLVLAGGPGTPAVPGPDYEVYAIQYAQLKGFPANALVLGAEASRKVDLSMMVWLLRGEGRVILVDAGFYRQQFLDAWKVVDFVKPSDAVARFGVKPEQVTDVVITHLHWDHADGADLFPNARVWVQRDEFEHYRKPENLARSGVFPDDIAMFEKIEREGRLHLVPGDSQTIARGVTVFTGGRHTRESQYLTAWTREGLAVIASDNVYLYENIARHRPIAATWDTVSNLAAQDRMIRMAGGDRLVVPGHDPAVFKRFKVTAPGVARIE
ncbi:MAG: N-acyl homoserine lactonase family protein [Gemmatimonadetes bacterium]|nr:N-acyl homoserine lactonase family protein [Gemmatimonadota bacterium]